MLATDEIHQDDPNFKLIYGCEAYFVDDMIPAVYGTKTMPITGSFVVFDTETTGLDSNVEALTEIGAVYVENGKINLSGSGEELLEDEAVKKAYLGG